MTDQQDADKDEVEARAEVARLRAENELLRAEIDEVDRRQQLPHPVKARLNHLRMTNGNLVLKLQYREERWVAERARADAAFRRTSNAEAERDRLLALLAPDNDEAVTLAKDSVATTYATYRGPFESPLPGDYALGALAALREAAS